MLWDVPEELFNTFRVFTMNAEMIIDALIVGQCAHTWLPIIPESRPDAEKLYAASHCC